VTSSNSAKNRDSVITKAHVAKFLNGVSGYTIYAPVVDNDLTIFKPVKNFDKLALHYGNTVKSPKYLFLPQTETMFTFKKSGRDKIEVAEPKHDEKILIFGIRPCDAAGIAMLDTVFSGDYDDSFYLKKRENSVLIGLACDDPDKNCFCTSTGGAPDASDGLDILLTDIGDSYYVNVLTPKGAKLVEKSDLFAKPSAEHTKAADKAHKTAHQKLSEKIDTAGLPEKLGAMFEHPFWKQVSMKCLGCGACTFLCPTCFCFDISDCEYTDTVTKRVRTWDSCQFGSYTLHTSGHNPRPNKENRMRNRILHKYKYHYDNFKTAGCTGCGRCIIYCPVNMNIKGIIKELIGLEIGQG